MSGLSSAGRTSSPPLISIPRNYNAAFGDAKLFHDDEAKRIAEGIPLVGVAPEQVDGSRFIERTHALNLAEPVLDIFEKAHGDLAAIARANPNQRAGFPTRRRSSRSTSTTPGRPARRAPGLGHG
jgi:hypothetical protein